MEEDILNSSPEANSSPIGNPPKKKVDILDKLDIKQGAPMTRTTSQGSSDTYGYNTGLGESAYDEGLLPASQIDFQDFNMSLQDYRGKTQPWYDKAAAGIARVGVKALTEIAKMPGFIVGSAMVPFVEEGQGWETAVNNEWIKALNNVNENINSEYLPVYVKKSVAEGNLWANISSIDFWATEGADGIGYIASMFAPGAAFKALGLGNKAMGLTAKGLSLINGEGKMAGAVETLSNLGIKAQHFDVAGTAMANTLFEAGAEAGNAMDIFQAKLDSRLASGEINQSEYDNLLSQKGLLGRDIFVSNMGILLVPNLIQSKMIWGKSLGKQLVRTETPSMLTKIANRGKNVLGATISEGFIEEAGQSTVENMFGDSAQKGKLTDSYTKDFNIGELANSYLDTIASTEGQKAMFLGAFLGGGMSAYYGAKSDKSNRENTNRVLDLADESVTNFNTIIEKDVYKRDENGDIIYNYNNKPQYDPVKVVDVAKALQFTEEQNAVFEMAVANGNTEVVDLLKERAVNQLIAPFTTQGEQGIDALRQHLETISQSPEIQQSDNNNYTKDFINETVKKAEYLQKQYQSYQDFSRDLINLKNDNATVEDLEDYYNHLADVYINKKAQEYTEKSKLSKLRKDKQSLLNELGDTELVENPNFIEGQTEDIYRNKREESDPRLKLINEKIEKAEQNLKDINSFVNEKIWDSKLVNEAFKNKVDQNNEIRAQESQAEEFDLILANIENTTDLNELNKFDTTNPQIAEKVAEKRILLQEIEDELDENVDEENENISDTAEAEIIEDEVIPEPIVQPLPTTDISVDGNANPINDIPVSNNENAPDTNKDLKALQPGAKVISTDRNTGNKLPFVSQEFLDYERTPRDKSKDKIGFGILIPEVENENWNKALEMYNSKDFSDLDFLYKHLPLEVVIPISFYGVSAPLETLTNSVASNIIFAKESLPLRKAIIDALASGSSFEDISSNIIKQFPGELKVQPQIENEDGTRLTPENNVLDLQVFDGMTPEQKLKEFAKRAYYVDYDGQLTSVLNKENKKGDFHKGKGEVFLEINQNNGTPYMLKLNFKRISEEKGDSIYEIIKSLSTITPTVDNLNIQNMTIEDFLAVIEPEERRMFEENLAEEIELINNTYENSIERTINKLLDVLVFQESTNPNTLFQLDRNGNLKLGKLASKTRIKKDELSNPENRMIILDFLKNKRHNVLITKDEKLMFNNPVYLNYLLNNNILSTNAVVNQPTFQGYSNIYLNQNIKVKNQSRNLEQEKTDGIRETMNDIASGIEGMGNNMIQEYVNRINNGEDFNKVTNGLPQSFINAINENIIPKNIINVFNDNNISKIGTIQQYRQYLETIFPESKVKDILYRLTNTNLSEFLPSDETKGIYASSDLREVEQYRGRRSKEDSEIYPILMNVVNPKEYKLRWGSSSTRHTTLDEAISEGFDSLTVIGRDGEKNIEVAVLNSNQVYILGNKNDLDNFKKYLNRTSKSVTLNEDGTNPETVAAFEKLLNEKRKPETKEDIKLEINSFDFMSLSPINRAKFLYSLKSELGITLNDSQNKRIKTDPLSVYNEMLEIVNSKNKNIDEIVKRCGY